MEYMYIKMDIFAWVHYTVFGTVSSLHPTSFLYLYIIILQLRLLYTCLNETKKGGETVNQKFFEFKIWGDN